MQGPASGDQQAPGPGAMQADALTGLPVMADFQALADRRVESAYRGGRPVALLVIDIDHFSDWHHALGQRQADALLLAVASSLRLSLPDEAVLGRLGSDSFAALLPGCGSPEAAVRAGRRLQADLADLKPTQLQALPQTGAPPPGRGVRCSIGISLAPTQARNADQLLRRAESALALARSTGPGGIELFSAAQGQAQAERRMVLLDLPAALQHGELTLRYQPQFAVANGQLEGVEALLRWQHPRHGLLLPERFIAAAEACGLIDELGQWVLREACLQARRWQDLGLVTVPMAVNVSAKQLMSPGFLRDVEDALAHAGLGADSLELEITESALVRHPERVQALLRQCRRQGLRISLDDFGTGHANLASLLHMPVDQIKIDSSFIADVPFSQRSAALVRALIQMAAALGMDVLAEGVETAAQLAFLRLERCNNLQGYLFSEALEAAEFETQPWCQLPNTVPSALS